MWDYFWKTFAILFIAVGPIENAAVYAGLAHDYTKKELKTMAYRACLIAGAVIIVFTIAGNYLLALINIQLFALQIGGGILLMILAIQTVMADITTPMSEQSHRDLTVFPLAMPLIAGPATITQATLLYGAAEGEVLKKFSVIGGILLLMVISYILLRLAGVVTRLLGAKGAEMFARVLGILLAALAADLIIQGIAHSGLLR
ncbi:MAG: antibiotic resistance protein MarC [Verrucomicrobia bacterium]|nr:MAG: antibiotic resistance protein MarC [Verrucomicrobiota bacterium]